MHGGFVGDEKCSVGGGHYYAGVLRGTLSFIKKL